ncbi:hypothetical protein B0J14DRAFT_653540 [Halenospora varia]|nr:hypothetical protein B0J14DRAFT_653540 [Halenospora varia]
MNLSQEVAESDEPLRRSLVTAHRLHPASSSVPGSVCDESDSRTSLRGDVVRTMVRRQTGIATHAAVLVASTTLRGSRGATEGSGAKDEVRSPGRLIRGGSDEMDVRGLVGCSEWLWWLPGLSFLSRFGTNLARPESTSVQPGRIWQRTQVETSNQVFKQQPAVALAEVSGRRRRAVQRMIYARWGNSVLQSEGIVCSDCRFSAEASQLEEKQKSRKAQKAGGWPPWEGANQGEYAAGLGKSLRP